MTERYTDEQFEEVFELVKGADSVELKTTVTDSAVRSTVLDLKMDPLDAEIRQVVFFDTPDLTLSGAGLIVRARRIQGGTGDTVIKLRPIKPGDVSPEFRKSNSMKVEVDLMPSGFVCSASLKGKTSAAAVRALSFGDGEVRGLFSKEQREFYNAYAPKELKLNDLTLLGPLTLLKLEFAPEDLKRKFVAEYWLYPDGSRLLELSTKCSPSEVFQVSAECRNFLRAHRIDVSGEQQPKTSKALKFFSAQLAGVTPKEESSSS
jgi:hypothetical protein